MKRGRWSYVLVVLSSGLLSGWMGMDEGEDQWIVFGSFRDGDFTSSVHAIRPDGSAEHELSLHPSGRPSSLDPWSAPDGRTILFTRGGSSHRSSVWMLSPHTSQERALTSEVMVRFDNGRAWPSFRPGHPDEFVFVRETRNGRRITLGYLNGDDHVDLGPGEFPAWSPDGKSLAYRTDGQVRVANQETGVVSHISGPLEATGYPSWSPSGERLVVTGSEGGGVDLYEIDVEGNVLRQLTRTPDVAESAARWSPDGHLLAFAARSRNAADGWQHSIYVLDVSTGVTREVTSGNHHDTRPTWMRGELP